MAEEAAERVEGLAEGTGAVVIGGGGVEGAREFDKGLHIAVGGCVDGGLDGFDDVSEEVGVGAAGLALEGKQIGGGEGAVALGLGVAVGFGIERGLAFAEGGEGDVGSVDPPALVETFAEEGFDEE